MRDGFCLALNALRDRDIGEKLSLVQQLDRAARQQQLDFSGTQPAQPVSEAGCPQKPRLVPIRHLPRRTLNSLAGRAAMLHSIAHIEFNAVNLALDAVHRFRGLPQGYYLDWIRVAAEEAKHFSLLHDYLQELGYRYGDFDAHDGLWQAALASQHSVLQRMALVPRVMEARGLDVTPAIIRRFKAVGDQRACDILAIILEEEIGHVEIGTRWFRYFCEQQGVSSEETFIQLLREFLQQYSFHIKGPFYRQARLHAGFTETEIARLEGLSE